MTVSLRNTPATATSLGTLTPSVAATYNGTTPVANDLLVAVVTYQANTTATVANLGATPSGWVRQSVSAATTGVLTVIYTKTAVGSDAAPTFTATLTTTAADCGGEAVIYDFSDSSGATPQLAAWGTTTGTSGTVAPVTDVPVLAGSYAIAANSAYCSTASAITWTTPSGWTASGTNSSSSANDHYASWHLAAPTTGSTLTCSMAHTVATTTHEAALVAVVAPPGLLDWAAASSTASTTLTWTHTVRTGGAGMLVVCADVDVSGDSAVTTAVTCDGTTMYSLGRQETTTGGGNGFLQAWTLIQGQVAAGAHTIVVTSTGGTPDTTIGVSASSPGSVNLGLLQEASDSPAPWVISVPSLANGSVVLGVCATGSNLGALTSAGTSLFINNVEGSGGQSTGNMGAAWAAAGFTGTGAVHASSGPCHSGYAYQPAGSRVLHPAGSSAVVPAVVQSPLMQQVALYRADAGATLPKGASGPTTFKWASGGTSSAQMGIEFLQPGPIQILTTSLPTAYINYSYSTTLVAQGGTQTGYTWSVTGGSLPSWATLNGATGVIYGNPPSGSSGTSTFTLTVTDSGSNTISASLSLTTQAFTGYPYITGIVKDSVAGGYYVTQLGQPVFGLSDNPWALITNAGEWTSGAWQADMSTYMSNKRSQGYKLCYVTAIGCLDVDGSFENGNTWDGVTPFNGGLGPDQGLNPTYWARVDYLIAQAAANGITVVLNVCYTANGGNGTFDPGGALYNLTPAQYTDYGYQLGQRYGTTPNLIWGYGNDYYATYDAQFGYVRSAIISTGDIHNHVVHNYPESTARYDVETGTGAQLGSLFSYYFNSVNFVYSYNVLYYGTELAYEEPAHHSGIPMLPAIWGDGWFGMTGTYNTAALIRQMLWWAVTSGARGATGTSNNMWPWASGSQADGTTDTPYPMAGVIRTVLEALPDWWQLLPDTSSVLVTSGRGTHASGISTGSNYTGGTDTYVTASFTPNTGGGSSLALIYSAGAFSIGINQSQMAPHYTATWVDPSTGAQTATTAGASYSSSGLGNNAAGYPDWLLVLQAPQAGALIVQGPLPPPKTAVSQFIRPQVITGPAATVTPVAQADTAGQADSVAVAAAVPVADVAGQADSVAVAAAVPVADVAGQADAVSAAAAVPLADVAGAADAITVTVSVPLADVAAAADAETTPLTGNTLTVLTAAVLQRPPPPPPLPAQVLYLVTQPPQTVTEADVAGAADQATAAAAVPLGDVAGTADAITVTVGVPVSDTGAATDSGTAAVTGNTLSVVVAAPPPLAAVPRPVPPQVIQSAYQVPGAISQPDTAGAADTLTVAVALSVADVAGEADTWLAGIATAEADTAGATDAVTVTVTVPLPDTGGGADTVTVAAAVPVADIAGAADAESVLTAAGPSPVIITALPVYPARLPPLAPQIIGALLTGPAAVPQADTAAAIDALTVAVAVHLADTAAQADTISNGVAQPLNDALLGGTITQLARGGSVTIYPYAGTITGGIVGVQSDIQAIVNNDIYLYLALTYNGAALNLTGYTLKAVLKATRTTPDSEGIAFAIGTGLTVTSTAGGLVTWDIPRADLPDATGMWYRVDVIDASAEVFTSLFGNFTVLPA